MPMLSRSKKILKIVLIIIAFILFLLLGLIAFVWLNRAKIEKYALDAINRNLNARLYVQEIRYSIFEDFPDVTLVLINTQCVSRTTLDSVLFEGKKLGITFDLWDILRGTYVIKKVFLSNGFLHLYEDKKGQVNYDILKSDTTSSNKPTSYEIKLNEIILKNIAFYYRNEQQLFYIELLADKIVSQGDFSHDVFNLSFDAKGKTSLIKLDSLHLLSEKPFHFRSTIEVDTKKSLLKLYQSTLQLQDLDLELKGLVNWNTSNLELTSSVKQIPFSQFASFLSEDVNAKLQKYTLDGVFDINFSLKGSYAGDKLPSLNLKLNIKNGSMYEPYTKTKVDKINLPLLISAKQLNSLKTYHVQSDLFTFSFGDKQWKGKLDIMNFVRPAIKFVIAGSAHLDYLKSWLSLEDFKTLQGTVEVSAYVDDNFTSFNAMPNELKTNKNISFSIKFKNGIIQHKDMPIPLQDLNAEVLFKDNHLLVNDLHLRVGTSSLDGQFEITSWESLFTKHKKLYFLGKVNSDHLVYKDLDALFSAFSKSSASSTSSSLAFEIISQINIKKFLYNTLALEAVKGKLYVDTTGILLDNFSFKTLGGNVHGKIYLEQNPRDYYAIMEINAASVDIRELFIEFNNFGQKDITSDNIRGRASTKGNIKMRFNSKGDVMDSSIMVDLTVELFDGELVGYAPLNDLKKYLKDRDFEHIYFDKIESSIMIEREKIYLSKTLIKSSVGEINVDGWQTFKGDLEYHIEIKYSELKRKKIRTAPEAEYGDIIRSKVNDPSIYLVVSGTVDNPRFALDKKTVKEMISNSLKQQKMELKEALKKEFGVNKRDSLKEGRIKRNGSSTIQVEWKDE